MGHDTMYRCSRCKASKPLADFPPSRARRPQWCRLCLREHKCGKPTERACDQCGSAMVVTSRRAAELRVYCSRWCKDTAKNRARQDAVDAAKPVRECPHCGRELDRRMRADARFCSERCEQSAHNATRKASRKLGERQELVSRAYIIERDGGRCYHCDAQPQGSDLHLDHLVPLAAGGSHEATNLVVSCARCNLSRGARGESQLLLVG